MKANRRSFLRLLGAAPLAAQEAASKMALQSGMAPVLDLPMAAGLSGPIPSGNADWAMRALKALNTPHKVREFRERAAHLGRILDPDLASMRSVSPSAAYSLQRERCLHRVIDSEKSWLEHQIEQDAKGLFS